MARREGVSDSDLIWDSWVLEAKAKEATDDSDDSSAVAGDA